MRTKVFILTQIFTLMTLPLLVACSGKGWDYDSGEKLKADHEYLYAEAFANSKSLEMATGKAEGLARAKLSQQIETQVDSMFKSFIEEVGGGADAELNGYSQIVTKQVSSNLLVGSKPVHTKWRKQEGGFEAYALMELPLTETSIAMIQNVRKNQHIYERLQASKGFKELEESVEKLKDERRQGMPQ